MSFTFDVRLKGLTKTEEEIKKAFKFGQFVMDNAIIKDSNFFIPVDQHFLERSAMMHSKIGKGKIIWQTAYARRLYYNPQYNFSKDVNPNAQGLWFEAAKALYKGKWLKQAELAIKSKL